MDTATAERIKVSAAALRKGDFLITTDCIVEAVYQRGLNILSGKVEVVTRAQGAAGVKVNHWGANTQITVLRPS